MLSDNLAIRVSNVEKHYRVYASVSDRVKQRIAPGLRARLGAHTGDYFAEFSALKRVSFEVGRGETVGIIGRNGSGKSTLLQIICGTLEPSAGEVLTRGRIAALLELGSGFNPDFSGVENVFLNASILGIPRSEIENKFDDIASFANIGDFLYQPVKNYSSGMVVRLAFAVQSQVDPDILVVDEALAVGDAKFQAKCYDRLRQLQEGGASVLLVTHSHEQILTHCASALLLEKGVKIAHGDPKTVVNRYLDRMFGSPQSSPDRKPDRASARTVDINVASPAKLNLDEDSFATRPNYNVEEYRWGDKRALIQDYHIASLGQSNPATVQQGAEIVLDVAVQFCSRILDPIFGITVRNTEGVFVYGTNSQALAETSLTGVYDTGQGVFVRLSFQCVLAPGDYFLSLGVASTVGSEIVPHDRRYNSIHVHVVGDTAYSGLVNLQLHMQSSEARCEVTS
ncbi:MAG: ABC transporter ATP-binding protein [Pseudomonadota bacterium]